MGFTLGVFFESVDNDTSLGNIAALTDTKYDTRGDDFFIPEGFDNLIAVYAIGDVTTRAQLSSPSLKKKAEFEIAPIDVLTEPLSRPPVINLVDNPVKLREDEALNALTINSGTAAVDQYVFVWLADAPITPVKGKEIFTVRATGSTTATADAWSNASMTLDSDLDPGTYEIVGFRAEGATMIGARLIFTKDESRPGVVAHDAPEDIEDPLFRMGMLGVWGEFTHKQPPKVEILCAAADTAQTYILDVVKKGGN